MDDVKAKAREERLKAALRDNLRRRKAQARGRESATDARQQEQTAPALPPKDGAD